MKSYEETVRSVLDRVHAGDAPKKPKRSKVIPAVIACCILTVGLAVRLLPVLLSSNQPGPNDVILDIDLNDEESSFAESSEEVSYPVIPGLYECYLTDETLGLASNENLPLATKRLYPEASRIEEYAKITELTINGVTYPCEYKDSRYMRDFRSPYRTHRYRIDCDGLRVDVTVRDDMSIVHWYRSDQFLRGNLPDVMTFEQAEKLALEYASQVIDVQKYEYTTSIGEYAPREGEPYELYRFAFDSTDDLTRGKDRVSIHITAKGDVSQVYIGPIDVYSNVPDDLIDEEKLEKTMLYYLEKLYPLYYGKELDGQYEFIERDLLLTPEGEWVLRNRYALVNGDVKKGIELTVVLLDTNAEEED